MPDPAHPRHSAKVNRDCAEDNRELCKFLSEPFDENFVPFSDQPTPEKKEELVRDAEAHERMRLFWDAAAPDLPR